MFWIFAIALTVVQTGIAQTASIGALPTGQVSDTQGSVRGIVKDSSGSVIEGAVISLNSTGAVSSRATLTDQTGAFRFFNVPPGAYTVKIQALGFAPWTSQDVVVGAAQDYSLPPTVLELAETSTTMNVGLPPHELAAEQMKSEEKQRVLGVFPNFFVTYDPNAAPLTAAQKFQLGWRHLIDPAIFITGALGAGVEQWRNNYPEFGQGMEGYGKRYGAIYATDVSHVMIGNIVTHIVFRQDPRYFYKGAGSFRSRALYAIGTAFVAKGDNGHWQFDYSDVVGRMAATEISTLYYPHTSRIARKLTDEVLLSFAGRAGRNLMQEFILRRFTTHAHGLALIASKPVLAEGTRVSLISIDDFSSKTAQGAGPITFVLASDLQVDGTVVAKAGSRATGEVTFSGDPSGGVHIELDKVRLNVGTVEVPLRSTPQRDGSEPLEFKRLADSGRIAIVLYVAQNTTLQAAQ